MAERFDILIDENNDPIISGGDFLIGESTQQHQKLLLVSNKGQFREHPAVGVGINEYLLDDDANTSLFNEIDTQFKVDGMIVTHIEIVDNLNLSIDAEYN
ncbi:MAG: hypothetical protein ACPGJS_05485 [Flammeovirgaceae bacterium]